MKRSTRNAVVRMIVKKLKDARLDQILVAQTKARIDAGGDPDAKFKPLDASRSHVADKAVVKGRRLSPNQKRLKKIVVTTSYRAGGQPLLDTRNHIYNRLNGRSTAKGNRVIVEIRGPMLAAAHDAGFETKGPNFVPLTQKARRTHRNGNDPKKEGLVENVDYYMAWKGVKVPAREFIKVTPENLQEIVEAIPVALKG